MLTRRIVLTLAACAALATPGFAADKKPFDAAEFDAAIKAGKSVFVEVHAPWCPNCVKQGPILSELQSQDKFKGLTVFKVDFDSQKDALRKLNVQVQSTLISFKGGKETARATGITDKAAIEKILNASI